MPDSRPPVPFAQPSQLPENVTNGDKKCANCHQDGETFRCEDCHIPGINTWYCSKTCQAEHWAQHKEGCRDRRRLIRATHLLSEIWDYFLKLTYASNIQFVKETKGVVHVALQAHAIAAVDPRAWTGESVFRPFPGDIVPKNASDAVKQAILHDYACEDVLAAGSYLINALLKPVCRQMWEARLWPKNDVLKISLQGNAPSANIHDVIRVKLASGEEFAIDLSGAQYGWQDKIYTWETYLNHRGDMDEMGDMGTACRVEVQELSSFAQDDFHRAPDELRHEISRDMSKAIEEFLVARGTTAKKFMSLASPKFQALQTDLIAVAKNKLHDCLHAFIVQRGIGRLYFHLDVVGEHVQPGFKVVRTDETADALKKVWFTREELKANRNAPMVLAEEWMGRLGKPVLLSATRSQ